MRLTAAILTLLWAISLQGCTSASPRPGESAPVAPREAAPRSSTSAYFNGKPVQRDELYAIMASQIGGEALAEFVLDRAVQQRLSDRGLSLSPEDIAAERQAVLDGLSSDEDQAVTLLAEMRDRRGLNDARFTALLKRNAGLRKMVAEEIEVGDTAIRQAYLGAYGPRYQVRLLVAPTLQQARSARAAVARGTPFTDVVLAQSTDASRAQGGLLSPINPVDTSYPLAIREALPKLKLDSAETRLSPILAIDAGFALLWLEDVIPAQDVALAEVEPQLRRGVRLQLERVRMQQLARSILESANVVVLDPLLQPGWEDQQEAIRRGGGAE